VRTNQISERLYRAFAEDFGCLVFPVPTATWLDVVHPKFRFGYMPPIRLAHPHPAVLVMMSPSLIAAVTAWLDELQLDTYLTSVEAFVGAHLMNPAESTDETVRRIEDELYTSAPEALRLVSLVEARAIDDGIVPA
jgi:hypothetical protein